MAMLDRCVALVHHSFDERMIPALHENMFRVFLEKGKGFDLSNIGPHVDTLTIKTALPLTPEQTAKINSLIASKLDRSLKIEQIHEPALIAGVLLQFGTLMLDGSLSNSIRETADKEKEKIQTEA
jgi:F0F1-type ATP synthase delta subunit